jgi:hypothetical protein
VFRVANSRYHANPLSDRVFSAVNVTIYLSRRPLAKAFGVGSTKAERFTCRAARYRMERIG